MSGLPGTCHTWLHYGRCTRAHCAYVHALPVPARCHFFFSSPGGCCYGAACRYSHDAPAPAAAAPPAPPAKLKAHPLLAQAAAARAQFAEAAGASSAPRWAPASIAAAGEELQAVKASLAGVEARIGALREQQIALCGGARGSGSRRGGVARASGGGGGGGGLVCSTCGSDAAHDAEAAAVVRLREQAFFTKKSLSKKVEKLEAGIGMLSAELANKRRSGGCEY